jgi:uncharacterized protein affecting Mg2+/Co2+ transport
MQYYDITVDAVVVKVEIEVQVEMVHLTDQSDQDNLRYINPILSYPVLMYCMTVYVHYDRLRNLWPYVIYDHTYCTERGNG